MTGEHLAADVQELIATLARHRVRFLLVGGEAVIHHGYARLTGDVDLWYDQTAANNRRLYAALLDFWGGDIPGVGDLEDLAEPGVFILFGRPPNRVDLLSRLGSVVFARAWRRRVREVLHAASGDVDLPIIGLDDLLDAKRDAARPKDLDDLVHLLGRRPG